MSVLIMEQMIRAVARFQAAPAPRQLRIGPGTKDRLIKALDLSVPASPYGIDHFMGVPMFERSELPCYVWILVDVFGDTLAAGVVQDLT